MIKDKDTTRSLSRVLENMQKQDEGNSFIDLHSAGECSFSSYLRKIMENSGLEKSEIVRRSGISRNYVYNVLSGSRPNPGRDKILALCIASEMNYRQTQQALEIAGSAPLYPRDPRDVRIAIAINSGMHDVMNVNLLLDEYGLAPLDI